MPDKEVMQQAVQPAVLEVKPVAAGENVERFKYLLDAQKTLDQIQARRIDRQKRINALAQSIAPP